MNKIDKLAKDLAKKLSFAIPIATESLIDDLKEVYLDSYEEELTGIVNDKNSLANPDFFYEDYEEALDNFIYLKKIGTLNPIIEIPTEDTFNFEGRLGFLKLLVNGVSGKYIELPQVDYDMLKSSKNVDDRIKRMLSNLPEFFDSSTPKELRFYLIGTRNSLYKTVQSILGKKLVLFPFSNSPPIPLFDEGIKFFESRRTGLDETISEVIHDSIVSIKRSIR